MSVSLFNFILVIMPILSSYSIVKGIDLGYMTIIFVLPFLYIFAKKKKFNGVFILYSIFFSYVIIDSFIILGHLPLRVILYTIVLYGSVMFFDYNLFYKYYEKVVFVCCVFFIIQTCFKVFGGYTISGILSFLPSAYSDNRDMMEVYNNSTRSASFFLEPSYFAQYLYPFVVIQLFDPTKTNGLKKAIYVSIILLILRSGTGLFLMSIIWVIWIFKMRTLNKYKFRIIFLILAAGLLLITLAPAYIEYINERVLELSFSEGTDMAYKSSGYLRYFNGYVVYDNLPSFNKIFGINPSLLSNLHDGSFLNGVSTILIMYGIVGLLFFLPHIMKFLFYNNLLIKTLTICVIYLLMGESYFPTSRMVFAMTIIYGIYLQDKQKTSPRL